MKKRGKRKSSPKKSKNLIFIILGIIIVAVIVYFIAVKMPSSEEQNSNQEEEVKENIKATFEWREPKTITPYGGRFYDKCPDGNNLGKVWASIELQNQRPNIAYSCKTEIIVKETRKYVDNAQWNLGTNPSKSGFIGFAEELTKPHLIDVCCRSKDELDSFCQTFEFAAYC